MPVLEHLAMSHLYSKYTKSLYPNTTLVNINLSPSSPVLASIPVDGGVRNSLQYHMKSFSDEPLVQVRQKPIIIDRHGMAWQVRLLNQPDPTARLQ